MNPKLLWKFSLTLVVCLAASLFVVWLLSRQFGFGFQPATVAVVCVLSVTGAFAAHRR